MSWLITGSQKFNWDPSLISTALWLDAADASTITKDGSDLVSTWADKSGNTGRNATSSGTARPTYQATGLNSKPALSWDGSDDFMTSSVAGLQSFTAFSWYGVLQTTAAAAADTESARFFGFGNLNNASGSFPANRSLGLASSTGALSGEYITVAAEPNIVNSRLGSTIYRRSANTAQILLLEASSSGTALRSDTVLRSLDAAVGITSSTNTSPNATGYTVDNDLHIGAFRASGTIFVSPAIKFSEVIVLSSIATTTTRQRIEGYLAHKWGLTANLPSGHPYKVNVPTP